MNIVRGYIGKLSSVRSIRSLGVHDGSQTMLNQRRLSLHSPKKDSLFACPEVLRSVTILLTFTSLLHITTFLGLFIVKVITNGSACAIIPIQIWLVAYSLSCFVPPTIFSHSIIPKYPNKTRDLDIAVSCLTTITTEQLRVRLVGVSMRSCVTEYRSRCHY
jgi:hypothetical protein